MSVDRVQQHSGMKGVQPEAPRHVSEEFSVAHAFVPQCRRCIARPLELSLVGFTIVLSFLLCRSYSSGNNHHVATVTSGQDALDGLAQHGHEHCGAEGCQEHDW